eukprot:TRINITY_DN4443_c0_g1_i1.p1 TRINITY_DN4443_c0_g1~~TRINITY_DN4443_c0_g1_i1.p1  ORF type:complete len:194 (-),score=25.15 TRINITY_DN4443_c0_g1_i1:337-918(-)
MHCKPLEMNKTLKTIPNQVFDTPPATASSFLDPQRDILCSLPLQIALHFNVYYSIAWIIVQIILYLYKLGKSLFTSPIIDAIFIIIWILVEPLRLYCGYSGNLRERMSTLYLFILLTIAPQLAVTVYLSIIQTPRFTLDLAVGVPMLAFLVVELVTGYFGARFMAKKQSERFYLHLASRVAMGDEGTEMGAMG